MLVVVKVLLFIPTTFPHYFRSSEFAIRLQIPAHFGLSHNILKIQDTQSDTFILFWLAATGIWQQAPIVHFLFPDTLSLSKGQP